VPDSPRRTGIIILSGSAVATIVLLFIGWTDLRSYSWSTASGTVTHGVIRPLRTRSGPAYEVNVAYTFTVGERSYAGSGIRFGLLDSYNSIEAADNRIATEKR
jgi:hypothetical protein